jgi:phosphoribosylformimino-5-aminoimidazole carboxamide ribonucleotide (ProFAR) isomerase
MAAAAKERILIDLVVLGGVSKLESSEKLRRLELKSVVVGSLERMDDRSQDTLEL